MDRLRRRLLAGMALGALPAMASSQPRTVRRIAWFAVGDPDTELPYVNALLAGLRTAGWEEGRNYGPNLRDIYRTAASYVDRILRGARPGGALGVTVAPTILLRADRVIE